VSPLVDKVLAGKTWSDVSKALVNSVLRGDCKAVELIEDVREFNSAQYGDSMIAIPMLISFKVPL
jgi:hypothetical protein